MTDILEIQNKVLALSNREPQVYYKEACTPGVYDCYVVIIVDSIRLHTYTGHTREEVWDNVDKFYIRERSKVTEEKFWFFVNKAGVLHRTDTKLTLEQVSSLGNITVIKEDPEEFLRDD